MSEESPLKDKVMLITGASSGIGEAFAKRAARTGVKLALNARSEDKLQEITEQIRAEGGIAEAFAGDVTDLARMKQIGEEVEARLGPVDVLVANAGTHKPTDITQFDSKEYEWLCSVNLFGAFHAIEAVLPSMITRKSGHLVLVASVAGYRGLPLAAAYGASKSALIHFSESIRLDLEPHGVDVSVVNPGFVRTPLTDKNDFEMPFLMEVEPAVERMLAGIEKRQFEVIFPWQLAYILKALGLLPLRWYHRLIRKVVKT